MDRLASKFGCPLTELWSAVDPTGQRSRSMPGAIANILKGTPFKKDGTPYKAWWVEKIWIGLEACCQNSELKSLLKQKNGNEELGRLCLDTAVTLTGRVRAHTSYTETRNTPFQGLASDGAKEACFELVRLG